MLVNYVNIRYIVVVNKFMQKKKVITAYERMNSVGMHQFTPRELEQIFQKLNKEIAIGLNRVGAPTSTDGGALAFPTYIDPISYEQLARVPNGAPVITCACGGTNWMFAVATKHPDGTMKLNAPFIRPIPEDQRQHTFRSLVNIIAGEIIGVANEYNLREVPRLPIAVSFGFPQHNVRTEVGDIDARLNRRQLPKFWEILDVDETLPIEQQTSITDLLRVVLAKRGMTNLGSIVFVNDTVAVALDVQHNDGADLPVGFVFGTGINSAIYSGASSKTKGIVNLEIGQLSIMVKDKILEIMEHEKFVPTGSAIMEYWMGGGYLPARLAATILALDAEFVDARQVARIIMESTNQALVSEIAENASLRQLQLHLGPREYQIIQEAARRVLQQAAQLIGTHIAAVSYAAGYRQGLAHVPFEGALLAKGYGVAPIADLTVKELLPKSDIQPYKASGILGIAKLALLKTQSRFSS